MRATCGFVPPPNDQRTLDTIALATPAGSDDAVIGLPITR
jgi:hypothetical protein